MATLSQPHSVAEFEKQAGEKLKRDERLSALWYFINLAMGDRQTFKDSKAAFKRFRFQPRILTAKAKRSLHTTVLGRPVSMPIGVSPVVGYAYLNKEGAVIAGRAASRAGTVMVLSSVGDMAIEKFGPSIREDGVYWAQTYLFKDKRNTLHIVRNAEKYGFGALVVTVDSPVEHKSNASDANLSIKKIIELEVETPAANLRYMEGRERDYNKFKTIYDVWGSVVGSAETFCYADWEDLRWLQSQTKLPIVLKGILTADSARRAAEFGVSGIIVSAHGGRQLEGSPAPLDALPDVVDAVKGTNVEVYMDGGIRTGNDVVKALALGARAVFIGRPALYGAAVNGEEGIYQVLQILKNELDVSMALNGCSSLQEISRSLVKHEREFHAKL